MKGFFVAAFAASVAWVTAWLALAVALNTGDSYANWIWFAAVALVPLVVTGILYSVKDYEDLGDKARNAGYTEQENERLRGSLKGALAAQEEWQKIALASPTEQKRLLAAKVVAAQTLAVRRNTNERY